jgi:hypothetical protein
MAPPPPRSRKTGISKSERMMATDPMRYPVLSHFSPTDFNAMRDSFRVSNQSRYPPLQMPANRFESVSVKPQLDFMSIRADHDVAPHPPPEFELLLIPMAKYQIQNYFRY